MSIHVSPIAVEPLRAKFKGGIVTPSDPTFDEARKIWNGDIDRRPALILQCTCVEDVQAGIAFARERGLPISVKGGGHSLPGHSVADGALMLDLRRMNRVDVNPATQRATVQGGAIWAEVDAPAQAHNLAVTGGHVTHTGVGGLTLGGGIGHLMRKFGLTVDHLLSAQIVTADGRVLRVSPAENTDLFWAIRGGGGNFGVATEFELQLAPLGPMVLGGLAFWAPEQGPELMRHYREFCASCPDEVTTLLVHLYAPPFDFVPQDVQHTPGYALVVAGTDIDIATNAIRKIRAFSPPKFDVIGPMPYVALQGMFDPALPHGTKTYFKAHYFNELSDEFIRAIHSGTSKMPPGMSQVFIAQMGGAVARVPDDATAVGGRASGFQVMCIGIYEDPADRPGRVAWVSDLWNSLKPFSKGAYVNLSDTQDEASLKVTYGAEKYARLQRIKAKYDPENVFRLNQNILPAK
jgi:hypothetical protein